MSYFSKRELIVILTLVIAVMVSVGFKIFLEDDMQIVDENNVAINTKIKDTELKKEPNKQNDILHKDKIDLKETDEAEDVEVIMIHITGEINNPGVIVLHSGDRLIDAVKKAGNLTEKADVNRINLAQKLHDEDKIYIPKIGEELSNNTIYNIDNYNEEKNDKIDINKASLSILESLPGIGVVKATKIIEYRNNKPFESIDEIINVPGIGDKVYSDIKDKITVSKRK